MLWRALVVALAAVLLFILYLDNHPVTPSTSWPTPVFLISANRGQHQYTGGIRPLYTKPLIKDTDKNLVGHLPPRAVTRRRERSDRKASGFVFIPWTEREWQKRQEEFSLTATEALDGVSEERRWKRKSRTEDVGVSELNETCWGRCRFGTKVLLRPEIWF